MLVGKIFRDKKQLIKGGGGAVLSWGGGGYHETGAPPETKRWMVIAIPFFESKGTVLQGEPCRCW